MLPPPKAGEIRDPKYLGVNFEFNKNMSLTFSFCVQRAK